MVLRSSDGNHNSKAATEKYDPFIRDYSTMIDVKQQQKNNDNEQVICKQKKVMNK
eukprot:UN27688